jgi:hypothetical protein
VEKMRMSNSLRSVSMAATVAGFLVASVILLLAAAQAHAKQLGQPELVWERKFDKCILAVGADEECFTKEGHDITHCLKWILFVDEGLRWLDEEGALRPEVPSGHVHKWHIAANGRYFCAEQSQDLWTRGIVHYSIYDWDGRRIWGVDGGLGQACVRNDGSMGFLDLGYAEIGVTPALGVKSFDRQGELTGSYAFPGTNYNWNWGKTASVSDNYFATVTITASWGLPVRMFSGSGRLLWERSMAKERAGDERDKIHRGDSVLSPTGGLVVSDSGQVLFFIEKTDIDVSYAPVVSVYDKRGSLQDTVRLKPTGGLQCAEVRDSLAFLTTGATVAVPGLFLCYDLRRMKVKFLLQERAGSSGTFGFEGFDVDTNRGLVAATVRGPGAVASVKVYDLDGNYKTEVPVDGELGGDFWLKMLDGYLLVAESDKLRLYKIVGG